MSSVPPVVVHARKVQMRAQLGALASFVAVGIAVVAVLPIATSLPPWLGLILLLIWSGVLTVGLESARVHFAAQAGWTAPVLAAFDEAEVARLVDKQVDCFGDVDLESNHTLVAIRKLSLRIEALADKREWIGKAVHQARLSAKQLATERRALARVARDDVDFEASRALIDAKLEALSKRLLVLFEELILQTSEQGLDAVSDALSRVSAESEVAHPGRTQLRVAR